MLTAKDTKDAKGTKEKEKFRLFRSYLFCGDKYSIHTDFCSQIGNYL